MSTQLREAYRASQNAPDAKVASVHFAFEISDAALLALRLARPQHQLDDELAAEERQHQQRHRG